jgi:plastocyanin
VTPRHLAISLTVIAATAAPIIGCGSSSDSGNAGAAATPSPSPHAQTSRTSPKSPAGGAGGVTIDNFKFAPATAAVTRGTRLVVRNHDSTAHTATADDGHTFDTGDIAPGAAATVTLSKPGRYAYHCSIHPFMHGTLVVK